MASLAPGIKSKLLSWPQNFLTHHHLPLLFTILQKYKPISVCSKHPPHFHPELLLHAVKLAWSNLFQLFSHLILPWPLGLSLVVIHTFSISFENKSSPVYCLMKVSIESWLRAWTLFKIIGLVPFCHWKLWLWTTYLDSLFLSFIIYKMEVIIIPHRWLG